MRIREFTPREELRPYVRLIWILEVEDPAAFGPAERIAPDGLLEVVFHYRTPLACRHAGEEFARQPRSVAVSQTRRFVEIRPEGASGFISVRFHPWGAYHFMRPQMAELADQQVATEHLWGRESRILEEQLAEAAGDLARVVAVEDFLVDQLRAHQKENVEHLVRAVWKHKGRVAIPEILKELGVGERWLQRRFALALGMTPKAFARLSRFLHACHLLRNRFEPTLADVSLASGYFDQSHFTAEFKAFSGMTPRTFTRATNVSFLDID